MGRFDDFFNLGGHSLLVVRLMFYLQEKLDLHVAIRTIMRNSTVAGLADYLENHTSDNVIEEDIDFSIDARLPFFSNVAAAKLVPLLRTPPSSIFLTGATGYLGIFILNALLENTKANILCLIRASSEAEGVQKLISTLKKYELYSIEREITSQRVRVICGDLSLPQFGLTMEQFFALCGHVDLIVHNGAIVNFMLPYASLKSANIEGTKTILQWAAKRQVPLHYVSSLYVFSEQDVEQGMIKESQIPRYPHHLSLGYLQTKCICEQLIAQAREQGLPIVNYRIGRISGSTQTGICQEYDFFWNFVKACLSIKMIPDIDFNINLIPVDCVSEFIAKISCQNRDDLFKNYHILNKKNYSFHAFQHALMTKYAHLGLTICALDAWKQVLSKAVLSNQLDESVVSLFPLLTQMTHDSKISFDSLNSTEVSNRLGIDMVVMNDALMALYIDKLVSQSILIT